MTDIQVIVTRRRNGCVVETINNSIALIEVKLHGIPQVMQWRPIAPSFNRRIAPETQALSAIAELRTQLSDLETIIQEALKTCQSSKSE